MNFNLIISTFRNREIEAASEFVVLTEEITKYKPDIEITGIGGLIVGCVESHPIKFTDIFRDLIIAEPWKLRYILRVIPIEVLCKTNLPDITCNAAYLSYKIPKTSSFKIVVEKRFCNMKSAEIISNIANRIDIHVNLTHPHWIILVEILGKRTGISILRPESILSVVKIKRDY